MNAGNTRDRISQYILTYGDTEDRESKLFMLEMQCLAQLQNQQYQTLFEILRRRGNMEAAEAGEKADTALAAFLFELAQKHGFDVEGLTRYLGGPMYPDNPDSVAVFDADFNATSGWEQAASEPIGDFHKRARILPVAMTTENALGFLQESWAVFERERCQPVIVALTKFPETVQQSTEVIGGLHVPIVGSSPENAMEYLCLKLNMHDCLASNESNPAQISSLHL